MDVSKKVDYVLITASSNEQNYIIHSIESVLNQSFLPEKWIIVVNNSNDSTYEFAHEYSKNYDFIEIIDKGFTGGVNFGSKAIALGIGQKLLKINSKYLGILDADIVLPNNYYKTIIDRMEKDSNIGLAGGIVSDKIGDKLIKRNISPWSVSGAIQVFNHDVFDKIGGIKKIDIGGEDVVAEVLVRRTGYSVVSFTDLYCTHLKLTGYSYGTSIAIRLKEGKRDYIIGSIFLYEFLRCIRRYKNKPIIFGSFIRLFGYLSAVLNPKIEVFDREISKHVMNDQKTWLKDRIKFFIGFDLNN